MLLAKRSFALLLTGLLLLIVPSFFIFSGRWQGGPGYFKQIWELHSGGAGTGPDAPGNKTEKVVLGSKEETWPEELRKASYENMQMEHLNLTSNMTESGNFFYIKFGPVGSYNPNIIPHPYKADTYFIIAQRDKRKDDNTHWYTALSCEAKFSNSTLQCIEPPMNLPIAGTVSEKCDKDLIFFNDQTGPHDSRVFYGPPPYGPYVLYGSQGTYNCLGQWIQDLRRVVDWGHLAPLTTENPKDTPFFYPTELQRSKPVNAMEKNWFPFWSHEGDMYMHYDLKSGHRAFAKLHASLDGTVGPDLAPKAAKADGPCLEKYLPVKKTHLEWNHQSTNSLSITLCNRTDIECHTRTGNATFIFTIFQHKSVYWHGVYEPYVMLFDQNPPFAVHGISSKPFWIPGRGVPGGEWSSKEHALADPEGDKSWVPQHQSQMLFIVAMSWKNQGQTYHGYLDDEVFVTFGVEDQASAGIAVKAGALIADLNLCAA